MFLLHLWLSGHETSNFRILENETLFRSQTRQSKPIAMCKFYMERRRHEFLETIIIP